METNAPPTHIVLNGFISAAVHDVVKAGLGEEPIPSTSKAFFVAPVDMNIPVGTAFQKIFNPSTGEVLDTTCVLTAVTQQQAASWDHVPLNWKTICRLDFPNGIPHVLQALPEIDDWFDKRSIPFIIATEEFWSQFSAQYDQRRTAPNLKAPPNTRGYVMPVKIGRSEAFELNAYFMLANLGLQDRKDILFEEMTHPEPDPDTEADYEAIEAAYNAIKDFTDPVHNRAILNHLKFVQRGATNVYLSISLSRKIGQNIEVVGEQEELPVTCPCCGFKTHEEDYAWNTCPLCHWEYDTSEEDGYSPANHATLREYREDFLKMGMYARSYEDPHDPDLHLKYVKDPSSTIPTPKHRRKDFKIRPAGK